MEVDEETYIGWNRYWPSIFILNSAALELLDRVRKGRPIETNEEVEFFLEKFKKYRFIFEGDSDPSKENFFRLVRQMAEEPDRRAEEFYREKEDYDDLKIVNNECNLTCCYCINRYQREEGSAGVVKKSRAEKIKIIDKIVDQYFARKRTASPSSKGGKNNIKEAKVFFSGGEILLEWELVKGIVQKIRKKYGEKGIKTRFEINTNLTLLTEEMADFFKRHDFMVHISIDGYRDAHNRTRKYQDGKGSFDDIIKKLEIYRRYYGENSLSSFQGTIEYPEHFSPEEVYKMEAYGFAAARLAPNLLRVSEENAREKARLMGKFLGLNSGHRLQVTELIFTRLKDKINQEEYRFSFNCQGLCALPDIGIEFNLSTMRLSHICGFIQKAALPIEKLEYDIYNPKLWDVSSRFIKERMDSLLTNCMDCELVGICVGGCVMSGLDITNRLNKAACAYQKEMWKIYVKKAYEDSKK